MQALKQDHDDLGSQATDLLNRLRKDTAFGLVPVYRRRQLKRKEMLSTVTGFMTIQAACRRIFM